MTEGEMIGWHHRLKVHESKLQELVMDMEAWQATIHWVQKIRTLQSN